MNQVVLADPRRVGIGAAELIADRLAARPRARLLLPTGRTPDGMYTALRDMALESAGATVLQLDEYAGVPPGDPRSFAAQLRAALAGIPLRAVLALDGAASDRAAEAARHAAAVARAPVDVAVLGLGRNGHVAFNEPPAEVVAGVLEVELTAATREDAAPAFGGLAHVPTHALTVGLGTLRAARELLLLVTGAAKADALRAMLEGPVGGDCPASLLRDHPRLTVLCDEAAAGLLRRSAA